jgi:hypothetical protein
MYLTDCDRLNPGRDPFDSLVVRWTTPFSGAGCAKGFNVLAQTGLMRTVAHSGRNLDWHVNLARACRLCPSVPMEMPSSEPFAAGRQPFGGSNAFSKANPVFEIQTKG